MGSLRDPAGGRSASLALPVYFRLPLYSLLRQQYKKTLPALVLLLSPQLLHFLQLCFTSARSFGIHWHTCCAWYMAMVLLCCCVQCPVSSDLRCDKLLELRDFKDSINSRPAIDQQTELFAHVSRSVALAGVQITEPSQFHTLLHSQTLGCEAVWTGCRRRCTSDLMTS